MANGHFRCRSDLSQLSAGIGQDRTFTDASRYGNDLLLDVNCSYSAFSFDMVVRLTQAEAQAYGVEGRPFVSRLAETAQRDALTEFRSRNVAAEVGSRVLATIIAARGSRAA